MSQAKERVALFKQSAVTVAIYNLLRSCAVGDVVTYQKMRDEIRTPITERCFRSACASAKAAALRDLRLVFAPVKGVGYKLLPPVEVVEASDADAISIRRRACKAVQKLATVDVSKLDRDSQVKQSARMVIFAAVGGYFSSRSLSLPKPPAAIEAATAPS